MGTIDTVRALVAPLLEAREVSLYDVEHAGSTLRVVVHRPGGVDLDTLGTLTRELSGALDAADPLPGRWYLEVSSPGLERTLRLPEHFAGAIGDQVQVKTVPGTEGGRRLAGRLVASDDDGFDLDVGGEPRRVGYDQVEKCKTVFEWGAAPHGGSPSKGTPGTTAQAKTRQGSER